MSSIMRCRSGLMALSVMRDAPVLMKVANPSSQDRTAPPRYRVGWVARRIGPVGQHPRNQPKIVHTVHDDAAEMGLAETALHVVVVEMQRVVVERGIAKQPDRFARDRKFRSIDTVAGVQVFECGRHVP